MAYVHILSSVGASAVSGRIIGLVWTGSTIGSGMIARLVEIPGSALIWPATAAVSNAHIHMTFPHPGLYVTGMETEVLEAGSIVAYMLDN